MNLSHKNMNFFPGVYREKSRARNWVRANVGTVDVGLEGGFTVDTATVNLITKPVDTVTNTANAVEKGSLIVYSITEGVVNAVGTGVDKDLGVMGTIEAVTNARQDVLTIVAIADNKVLAKKIDGALEGDASTLSDAVNEVSETVQKKDGVDEENISHVNLYQGEETDNAMSDYAAAYDQENNATYLNTEGTDISKGGDIIESIFWEAQRKDNYDNDLGLDSDQQFALASSRGEQAGNLWNRFSETASTTSNYGGIVNWNNANAGSDTLMNGSDKANKLDTTPGNGVVPRWQEDLGAWAHSGDTAVNEWGQEVRKGPQIVGENLGDSSNLKIAISPILIPLSFLYEEDKIPASAIDSTFDKMVSGGELKDLYDIALKNGDTETMSKIKTAFTETAKREAPYPLTITTTDSDIAQYIIDKKTNEIITSPLHPIETIIKIIPGYDRYSTGTDAGFHIQNITTDNGSENTKYNIDLHIDRRDALDGVITHTINDMIIPRMKDEAKK